MPDTDATALRPARPEEAALLQAWRAATSSPFDDYRPAGEAEPEDRRLPRPDGLDELVVTDGHDRPIGTVQWHPVRHGPTAGSLALNIGISLQPAARGRGHGTRAQRQLVAHLLAHHPVHRVEAGTDVDNVAEQRALERAGFTREGVLRGAQWRGGSWHDLVSYAVLRTDLVSCRPVGGGRSPCVSEGGLEPPFPVKRTSTSS